LKIMVSESEQAGGLRPIELKKKERKEKGKNI
jgi:hypothetical protein